MTYRVQVSIPYFSGLPGDVVTNTWAFNRVGAAPGPTELAQLAQGVAAFYDDVYTNPRFIAPWLRPAQTNFAIYDLDDIPPRVPVYDQVVALVTDTTPNLQIPQETAVVMSFQGDKVSGLPQARRRGRIYLGGISLGFIATGTTTSYPFITLAARTAIVTAAQSMQAALAAVDWIWVVYSTVNESATPVTNGWLDDSIDTQRRRGNTTSSRLTFTV
jgi:hypothetical protein